MDMKCRDVKRILEADYIDGRLEEGLRKEIDRHLESCPDCRHYLNDLSAVSLKMFQEKEAPAPFVWENIKKEIYKRAESPKRSVVFLPSTGFSLLYSLFPRSRNALLFASLVGFVLLTGLGASVYRQYKSGQIEQYLEEELAFLDTLSDDAKFEDFLSVGDIFL